MLWIYILNLVIFVIFFFVLARAGSWAVESLSRISQFLGWKEFVVSFILMAFTTSLPEFFVGISSALHGRPQLSFGNVIGSNVINLTLLVGVSALLAKGLKMERALVKRDALYVALIGFLPVLLLLDKNLSRGDGIVLILFLFLYFFQLSSQKEAFTRVFSNSFQKDFTQLKQLLIEIVVFFVSVGALLLAADGIVRSANFFAKGFDLSLLFVGIFIVAFGTNLPEFTFGIKSILLGHKEMVLGNLMGSVVVNSTLILGVTALLSPIEVPSLSPFFLGIVFTFLSTLFFYIFSRTNEKISQKEAIFLILFYILFVLLEIFYGRFSF